MISDAKRTKYEGWPAVALVALGLSANPYMLAWLFAPDGSIDGEARVWQIILFDVFFVVAGIALGWSGLRTKLRPYVRNAVAGTALVGLVSATIVGTAWGIWAYRTEHHHTTYVDGTPPSAAERVWADEFVRKSFDSARRHGWFDIKKAEADGFVLNFNDNEHWFNREFIFDDKILDPDRPEFLLYMDTPRGRVLIGFMYYGRTVEERAPQPGGNLTVWHYHPWGKRGYCADGTLIVVGRPDYDGNCAQGVKVTRSPEMLHVYFVDHPLGPYTNAMSLTATSTMWDPKLAHPMVVHFVIALFIVAALLDIAGRLTGRRQLHDVAFANLLLAVPAALAAVAAGMWAEVQLLLNHDVHQVLDQHKVLGFTALAAIVALAGWRVVAKGAFPTRGGSLYLTAAVATAVVIGVAGHRGSELVYMHGTGVQAVDRFALERYERALYGTGPELPSATPAGTHVHGR